VQRRKIVKKAKQNRENKTIGCLNPVEFFQAIFFHVSVWIYCSAECVKRNDVKCIHMFEKALRQLWWRIRTKTKFFQQHTATHV